MISEIAILLIEDSQVESRVYSEYLQSSDFIPARVHIGESLSEGLQILEELSIDLVLLDLGLPDSSGLESLLSIIKKFPSIPVIILTSTSDPQFSLECIQAGAQDYIVKGSGAEAVMPRICYYTLERFRAQERARKSDYTLRLALDSINSHIAILDSSGLILHVNNAWEKYARENGGTMQETGPGVNYFELCRSVIAEKEDDYVRKFLTGVELILSGTEDSYEMEYPCSSPEQNLWFVLKIFRPRDETSNLLVVSHENITRRKLAELGVLKEQAYLQGIIDTSPNLIFLKDQNGRFILVNQAFASIFDKPPAFFSNKTIGEILGDKGCRVHSTIFEEADEQILQNNEAVILEDERITDHKEISRRFRTIKTPLLVSGGQHCLLGISTDITAYKTVEENLKQREKEIAETNTLLQSILDVSPNCIVLIDKSLYCQYVNWQPKNLFGLHRSNPLGRRYDEIFTEEIHETLAYHFQQALAGRIVDYELEIPREDNTTNFFHAIHVPRLVENEVTGFLAFFTDISDRKNSEKTVNLLNSAIEQVDESIVITDTEGFIQYVNPAFEQITGYSTSESIGQNVNILKSGKHDTPFYQELWNTLLDGDTWTGRIINRKKNGSLFTEDATISPVRDSSGNTICYVAVKRDISNVLQLEQQLRQAQKMESLGTLAGGIAHDFNNILTAIMGFTELSIARLEQTHPILPDLDEVYNASMRAKDLVHQILTFSRRIDQTLQPIDIAPVLKEALKLLRSTLPSTISLKSNIARHVGKVLADPTQIHQIVMNLCTNAAHAMNEFGGELTVSLSTDEIAEESELPHPALTPGTYLKLTVKDTGKGIPQAILPYIFDPYFTTKDQGEGTGLGLAVVHGIIQDYSGIIFVESEQENGALFTIMLPVSETDSIAENGTKSISVTKGNGEFILVVDDEKAITLLCSRLLEQIGYRVHAENNSLDALKFFTEHADEVDFVLSDMTMPHLTGDRLLAAILEKKPQMPAILMSGNAAQLPEILTNRDRIKLMAKPVEKAILFEMIHSLLHMNPALG
ncbi:MAG: PAS domain S-box protein [Desulfobulbaceae bacterium]|nr:MAG: PAS domain S-box protein [Desulfobulbaceae bacterium]